MKKLILTLSIAAIFQSFNAQEITLDKIYSGYYRGKGIAGITSMKNGENYLVIEQGGIAKYSYKTSQKEGNLVDGSFESYEFSDDESKILLLKESQPIYRHSFLGKYDIKDFKTGKIVSLNEGKAVQEPRFSPDASKISFIVDNNLFYQDLNSGKITQITQHGVKNKVLNGLADWVYEEEFGHARLYEWTKNSADILFVKLVETDVPEIYIPMYEKSLYPTEMRYKYPKAGEKNSIATAHIYQLSDGKKTKVNLDQFKNYYIPNVIQTSNPDEIVLIT
ncbi:MAG: DPP IV N-terminal domain-containing protein, partial [Chryseobacterium sp.]